MKGPPSFCKEQTMLNVLTQDEEDEHEVWAGVSTQWNATELVHSNTHTVPNSKPIGRGCSSGFWKFI